MSFCHAEAGIRVLFCFCFQAEDGIRDRLVTGVQTCALPILSGGTAKMVASPKPMVPIFSFTSSLQRARLLNLVRGAVPFLVEEDRHLLLHIEELITMLKNKRLVKKGDRVVITTGIPEIGRAHV